MVEAILVGLFTVIAGVALAHLGRLPSPPVPPGHGPRPDSPPPAQRVHTTAPDPRAQYVLGANPYGLPTNAPLLGWDALTTTAFDPALGLVGGEPVTVCGEPYTLKILPDGRLVGLPLRTDAVIPVTGGTQVLARACTVCGEALAPDAAYCVTCGQAVAAMAFE